MARKKNKPVWAGDSGLSQYNPGFKSRMPDASRGMIKPETRFNPKEVSKQVQAQAINKVNEQPWTSAVRQSTQTRSKPPYPRYVKSRKGVLKVPKEDWKINEHRGIPRSGRRI